MRILFVTRKWKPAVGGMETYSVRLSEELARKADIEVVALNGRPDGRPPSAISLFLFGLKTALLALRTAPKFEVLHGGDMAMWPIVCLGRMRNRRASAALSAHGTDVAFALRKTPFGRLYRLYLRVGLALLSDAKIVANSHATSALLRELNFKEISVVPLAADITKITTEPNPPAQPYVLFVGRLIERKGCGWFIENVLPSLPGIIKLKVAGTVSDTSEKVALKSDRVEFLGPVFGENLSSLRQNALAVLVPNTARQGVAGFEGFGLTAVEGVADGGIVLASNVDGITDAVCDGVTGFLLPPEDADAWRTKIVDILNWGPSKRLAFLAAARMEANKRYSWSRVATDTIKAYGIGERALPRTGEFEPLISVVMPVFNAGRYLEGAIKSIQSQTLGDYEFLIIDDCSTDNTAEIISRAAIDDNRIRVLRNASNLGVTRSLNRGLSEARGQFIARMDGDDVSLPRRFEQQVHFLESNPKLAFCACGYEMIDHDDKRIKTDVEATEPWECRWLSMFRMPVNHPTIMFRSNVLREHSLQYDESYTASQDLELVHRLLNVADGCAVPEVLFQYRMHTDNVSTSRRELQRSFKLKSTTQNAIACFPGLDAPSLAQLFRYVHGPSAEDADLSSAILTLRRLETAFVSRHRLTRAQAAKLRNYSARWLAAAALRRGAGQSPQAFSRFLWSSRTYLQDFGEEALAYAIRRIAA